MSSREHERHFCFEGKSGDSEARSWRIGADVGCTKAEWGVRLLKVFPSSG